MLTLLLLVVDVVVCVGRGLAERRVAGATRPRAPDGTRSAQQPSSARLGASVAAVDVESRDARAARTARGAPAPVPLDGAPAGRDELAADEQELVVAGEELARLRSQLAEQAELLEATCLLLSVTTVCHCLFLLLSVTVCYCVRSRRSC